MIAENSLSPTLGAANLSNSRLRCITFSVNNTKIVDNSAVIHNLFKSV